MVPMIHSMGLAAVYLVLLICLFALLWVALMLLKQVIKVGKEVIRLSEDVVIITPEDGKYEGELDYEGLFRSE